MTDVRMKNPEEKHNSSGIAYEREDYNVGDRYFHVSGWFQYHVSGRDSEGLPTDYSLEFVIDSVDEIDTDDIMRRLDPEEALSFVQEQIEDIVEDHDNDMADRAESMV